MKTGNGFGREIMMGEKSYVFLLEQHWKHLCRVIFIWSHAIGNFDEKKNQKKSRNSLN